MPPNRPLSTEPAPAPQPPTAASVGTATQVPIAAAAAPPGPGWRQALAAWLLAHKTYPDPARQRGIEGTVGLRFTLDRAGHVIDLAVNRSSGSELLDSAAEAMLRNATLPPPDPPQDRITISVQLHYALMDR